MSGSQGRRLGCTPYGVRPAARAAGAAVLAAGSCALVAWVLVACAGEVATRSASPPEEPPAIATIALEPRDTTVLAGASFAYRLSLRDASGNALSLPEREIAWSSSDTVVATVANGVLAARAAGTATLMVASRGKQGTATVLVRVPVGGVTLDQPALTLRTGQTAQLTATVKDPAGKLLTDRPVTWSTNSAQVATVSAGGLVTAVGVGSARITASSEGWSAGASVVVPANVAAVTFASPAVSLVATQSITLVATPRDSAGNALVDRPVTWRSSDTTIVRLSSSNASSANVVGVRPGAATVSATSEGKTGAVAVTVASRIAAVTLSRDTATLPAGGARLELAAVLRDSIGRQIGDIPITWSTSNPAVATVSLTGVVTTTGDGTSTITASAEGRSAALRLTSLRLVFAQIAASTYGSSSTCALTVRGEMYCWGGQIVFGDGTVGGGTTSSAHLPLPTRAAPPLTFTSVSTSSRTVCGAGPTAFCWGANNHGTVGNGTVTTTDVLLPARVGGFAQISTSGTHTCALTATGTVSCWGENYVGQLGIGARTLTGGPVPSPTRVPNLIGTWVNPSLGIVDSVFRFPRPFSAVTAGADFTCALVEDSLVVKVNPVPFPPTRIGGVFRRACWGHNFLGQLGIGLTGDSLWRVVPTESSTEGLYWTAISASPYNQFACGIGGLPKNVGITKAPQFVIPGELRCWGWNGEGELGIGVASSIGPLDPAFGRPLQVPLGDQVTSVSAGAAHACAIAGGRAYCWGKGTSGQLGNGTFASSASPVAVAGGLTFRAIAAGGTHTCAITTSNITYCWGTNAVGELGNGTFTSSAVPVRVLGNP